MTRVTATVHIIRSDAVVEEMNQEPRGIFHISRSHSDEKTHMWTSRTLAHYLNFLTLEIRQKRMELGLDASHKALVLCDAASFRTGPRCDLHYLPETARCDASASLQEDRQILG